MKQIQLYPKDIYKGPLILVNQHYPLQHEADFAQMLEIQKGHYLDRSAAQILRHLLHDLNMEHQITIVSAWRSFQEQTQLFENSVKENGIEYTRTYVASPGCSEHQSSYAIDLAKPAKTIDFIAPELPFNGPYAVLRKKLTEAGFILRYPKHKQHITNIGYEPWHFRYVGIPHSQIMEKMDLSLEEYHELLKRKTKLHPLRFSTSAMDVCIYTHSLLESEMLEFEDNEIVQISGNNMDGFIITNWRKCHETNS